MKKLKIYNKIKPVIFDYTIFSVAFAIPFSYAFADGLSLTNSIFAALLMMIFTYIPVYFLGVFFLGFVDKIIIQALKKL